MLLGIRWRELADGRRACSSTLCQVLYELHSMLSIDGWHLPNRNNWSLCNCKAHVTIQALEALCRHDASESRLPANT